MFKFNTFILKFASFINSKLYYPLPHNQLLSPSFDQDSTFHINNLQDSINYVGVSKSQQVLRSIVRSIYEIHQITSKHETFKVDDIISEENQDSPMIKNSIQKESFSGSNTGSKNITNSQDDLLIENFKWDDENLKNCLKKKHKIWKKKKCQLRLGDCDESSCEMPHAKKEKPAKKQKRRFKKLRTKKMSQFSSNLRQISSSCEGDYRNSSVSDDLQKNLGNLSYL